MVSNCAWASPQRTSSGTVLRASCRKRSSAPSVFINSCGGGGTKAAVARVLPRPPIQFCEVRNSPGDLSPPGRYLLVAGST